MQFFFQSSLSLLQCISFNVSLMNRIHPCSAIPVDHENILPPLLSRCHLIQNVFRSKIALDLIIEDSKKTFHSTMVNCDFCGNVTTNFLLIVSPTLCCELFSLPSYKTICIEGQSLLNDMQQ